MTPREAAQAAIVDHLLIHADYWDAPYGIITALQPVKAGKVRTITFGVSAYLDASAWVWSPSRIEVRGQGGLAREVEGTYDSPQAFIDHLDGLY